MVFAALALIDLVVTVSNAVGFGDADYSALVVLDAVVLTLALWRGNRWWRSLAAAVLSLGATVWLMTLPGIGGGGLTEQAALGLLTVGAVRELPVRRAVPAVALLVAPEITSPGFGSSLPLVKASRSSRSK